MSARVYFEREEGALNLSGQLKVALRDHAFQRCRHFFLYQFYYKALIDYLNAPPYSKGIQPLAPMYVNATYQADEGFRSDEDEHYLFDAKDPNVVDKDCTSCGKMDASHFCNLGIQQTYRGQFAIIASKPDDIVKFLFGAIESVCGNTRHLPQRVNIGPDRRVDRFHGELAIKIQKSGQVPVSITFFKEYIQGMVKDFGEYKADQIKKGNHGIAACVDAYVSCYANDLDAIWKQLANNVIAECTALKLDVDKYLSLV